MQIEKRQPAAIDKIVDDYLTEYVALDPILATQLGLPGHETRLPDFSPDGHAEVSALRQRTLRSLAGASAVDTTDRVTVAAARDQLESAELIRATGADESRLNNIDSPLQNVRKVFDLMVTSTADDWAAVATRLSQVPVAIDSYIASLRFAAARGEVSPRRQVDAGIAQARRNTGTGGFFATFVEGAALEDGELPAAVRSDLERGAQAAADAYRDLSTFLIDELLSKAPTEDAVGTDQYALHSRSFLGASVDLQATYEWGQSALARITADMSATAERIRPGASIREAMDHLNNDPSRRLHGTEALRGWMQEKSDAATEALADTHFDIPGPVRRLECLISPTTNGSITYTEPSEDFSRPGRIWWAVPEGATEFSTWRELTTLYHEGVPGHHLQIGQAVVNRGKLNTWRRQLAGTSGHAEGWALYAERLMEGLGYLDDPADRLGMLDGQRMRAARVVLDIGVHLGKQRPDGNGPWTGEYALEFLSQNVNMNEGFVRFEVNRYLGWPGQAPSYKVGQRIWEQLRDELRRREGDRFDIREFHRRALDLGGVGLDTLRGALLDGAHGG